MLHSIVEKSKEQELNDHHDNKNNNDKIFHSTLSCLAPSEGIGMSHSLITQEALVLLLCLFENTMLYEAVVGENIDLLLLDPP
jgi:hypothetical protein